MLYVEALKEAVGRELFPKEVDHIRSVYESRG